MMDVTIIGDEPLIVHAWSAKAKREKHERTEPEDPCQRFERRIVENEISVTRHHVVANLRVGCALLNLLVNDQT